MAFPCMKDYFSHNGIGIGIATGIGIEIGIG